MEFGLDGCAALVGGASSGIGLAVARALAAEGCDVVLFARRAQLLEEEAREISGRGAGRASPFAGDSRDTHALAAAVQHALDEFGRLDVLVANTGGPPAGGFADFDDADWQSAYELTLLSTLRLTREALPALRAGGRGRIVAITSSVVKEPAEGLLLSNALRSAVTGWAKTLAREEGPRGVTVNCVAPGYVDTDRMKELYAAEADPETARRRDTADIPAARFAAPEEVAAVVAFLCSTQAAFVSGITLLVDGGQARGLLS